MTIRRIEQHHILMDSLRRRRPTGAMSKKKTGKSGTKGKDQIRQLRKSIRFGRILVPVDFSETSLLALLYAARLAGRLGSQLSVLHVVYDPPESPGSYAAAQASDREGSIIDTDSAARSMLKEFVARSRIRKKIKPTLLCEPGIPGTRIVEIARAHKIHLIVMASNAGSVRRFFLGSTADRVARSAHCPVLFARLRGRAGDEQEPEATPSGAAGREGLPEGLPDGSTGASNGADRAHAT